MITSDDIAKESSSGVKTTAPRAKMNVAEIEESIDLLLEGFDAENNLIDRRIFYETTGRQMIEDEFWLVVCEAANELDDMAGKFLIDEELPPPDFYL